MIMRRRHLLGLMVLPLLQVAPARALTPAEQAFLDRLSGQGGWRAVPQGPTLYRIVKSGPAAGVPPRLIDTARMHYQGRLEDGTVFEDTRAQGRPAALQLTRVIAGWKQVLPLMRPGDVWELAVPASAGYGAAVSASGKVPAGSNLFFTIELLSVTRLKLSSEL
ncbi:FKBP-type peptidyl-prolyl cis-trans isomerase [Niveispirillum fermenti]|uniref:FKBP-type peptidyl-prolyl cis-trans isomerase n=1 Tax=Niveispirillum fermenti TaxID=1233113 RepID=UPI003A895151